MHVLLRPLAVIGLMLAVPACGAEDDGSTQVTTTVGPATTEPAAQPATTVAPTTATPTTGAPTTGSGAPVDVKIYLLRGERLVIAHRQVPGPEVLEGALTALLDGPTADERASGLTTTVPEGTELLGVALADGQATVDLDETFGTGGGSLSMSARVAQVVFTATQFDNVDRVLFWMNGAPVEALGGEGLILTDPQSRMMVDPELSGSVIFDTPAWGATVTSPFTVTGEGDVYEGQFPIEVWRDGEQIGGVAPVTAGAWGTWGPFEATITLAGVAPGPIELVGYDEGGCGTDPECPPIVKTVVPLTLGGLAPTRSG